MSALDNAAKRITKIRARVPDNGKLNGYVGGLRKKGWPFSWGGKGAAKKVSPLLTCIEGLPVLLIYRKGVSFKPLAFTRRKRKST